MTYKCNQEAVDIHQVTGIASVNCVKSAKISFLTKNHHQYLYIKNIISKKIIIIIKIKNRTNLLSNYIPLLENIAIKSKILDFNFLKKNFTLEHKNLGTKFIHDFLDWPRNFHRLQTIWHLIGIANSRCRKMETPRLSIVAVVKASISFPFVQQWARARKNESGLELDRNVRPVLEAFSIIYLDSRNRYTSCH